MNISLSPETLFFWSLVPITNTLVVTLFLSAAIIVTSFLARKKIALVPKKAQNVFEVIVEFLLGLVEDIMQDRKLAQKTFPLIITIFLFVWISNFVELVPGLGTIGIEKVAHGEKEIIPFLRSASADMNMTLALAIISVVAIHYFGVSSLGASRYLKKFFVSPFRKPYIMGTCIGILELIGEFSRLLSFSFRLFGNIFAGEVLLIVMLGLVPYIIPIPFLALELLVGVIQALVFAVLTAAFIKMATMKAHN